MPGFDLLKEQLVFREFKTLNDLYKFADSYFDAENLLFLARQDHELGYYRYHAVTIEAFLKR